MGAVRASAALASGCAAGDAGVGYGAAPSLVSGGGVAGTTSADLAAFGARFNAIRASACLPPIPPSNIRYDDCLQQRLFWVAEDPSTNRGSAWGHQPTRSDGAAVVGCDGNLAGGSGYTGATAADRWWQSPSHQQSLYRPASTANAASICIGFAMTHGGLPNEPASFARAAAVRYAC
ncbi:hypothetical protein B0I08_1036 [Glaciihabitans tibetensis]|uniref:Cysteine-rich secretory family protein n=1 Tax=Glaciihabitans tibetensis TaxID=1266600 RepID=A0A2T0VF71_9MICO|nr:hypothetical protein B0I08_1036 [Glaciihabitans tibetensis]